MNLDETLRLLKSLGTGQNQKVYRRHGVGEDFYGVSFADLGRLQKQIKVDHALALELWASGNHDARILATRIADPARVTGPQLDSWARELDNYIITDNFSDLAARTAHVRSRAEKWGKAKGEWVGRAGWRLVAHLALHDPDVSPEYFEDKLSIIEREIHGRKNKVRDAMNSALIAIGLRSPALQKLALAAAKRIGKVEVDHGQTSCVTPEAAGYILKAAAHRKGRMAARPR